MWAGVMEVTTVVLVCVKMETRGGPALDGGEGIKGNDAVIEGIGCVPRITDVTNGD